MNKTPVDTSFFTIGPNSFHRDILKTPAQKTFGICVTAMLLMYILETYRPSTPAEAIRRGVYDHMANTLGVCLSEQGINFLGDPHLPKYIETLAKEMASVATPLSRNFGGVVMAGIRDPIPINIIQGFIDWYLDQQSLQPVPGSIA